MSAHPAGPRHAEGEQHTAMSSAPPANPTELASNVWPRNASRGTDGEVTLAGLAVSELAEQYGTPLFVIDEDDFRSRCRDMAAAFGGAARVHYASKAFLCTEVARWIKDEGLGLTSVRRASWLLPCVPSFRLSESAARQQQIRGGAGTGGPGRCRAHCRRLDD